MLERLRSALVKSYVGAIAIGWLVAQGFTDVSSIFAAPLTAWITQRLSSEDSGIFRVPHNPAVPYWMAVPPLIRAVLLLLIAFLLLRWLYFEPAQKQISAQLPEPDEKA